MLTYAKYYGIVIMDFGKRTYSYSEEKGLEIGNLQKEERMKKRVLYITACIALGLLMIFDLSLCLLVAGVRERSEGGGVVFDPSAEDERTEQGTSVKGPTVKGFSSLTIPPDMDTVPIDLYNPIENSGLYYMTFELRLPDESEQGYEVLFKTGYVAPGKHIYQVTLTHSLQAGEYTAHLLIQPYRMQGVTPTNNVSATIKLTVK